MRLIKIDSSSIHIKSDDKEFEDIRLNELISVSDGEVTLVTMVTSMTDNDADSAIGEDDFIMALPSLKVIECSIIGSVTGGRFSKAVGRYPKTKIKAEKLSGQEFEQMILGGNESFSIGTYANYDCPAWVDGNKFYQRHSCIVGNTGCGKSETVAKILVETASHTDCNIVLFDIHGEYGKLSYVDPIVIGKDVDFPIWILSLTDIAANILKLKEETATVAMSALRKCYRTVSRGGNESKPNWFDFRTLLRTMQSLNEEVVGTGETYKTGDKAGKQKTVKGDYNGKLSGVINTMETLMSDRRYAFLFKDCNPEYLGELMNRIMGGEKPVKAIDLSGVPHDVAVLIIGTITKLVYNIQIMQKQGEYKPITLVCDEAHVYIPVDFQLSASQRRMVDIFENIAKEGRKFGITLLVASQRPSELNRTIMAQCANFIVMKLNNENDKTMIKGMMPDGSSSVIETTTMFQPGDALIIGDAAPIPMKIHVELASERPQSRTIDFWDEWQCGSRLESVDEYLEEYLRS